MAAFVLSFVVLSLVLLLAIEIGYRVGTRDKQQSAVSTEPEKISASFVMTLLGLLLAFSLSAARSNFSDRASMILREADDIRIARVELEKLDTKVQDQSQSLLMDYVESRKEYNQALSAATDANPALKKGQGILHEIRRLSRQPGATKNESDLRDVLSQLERVAGAALERNVLVLAKHNDVVINLLFVVSLIAAFLYGHAHRGLASRQWWAGLLFATVVAATTCIISDYDSPRLGIIRVDHEDALFDELGHPPKQSP